MPPLGAAAAGGRVMRAGTSGSFNFTASGFPAPSFSVTNGTLPPAYQSQVDQAINDAKTNAIANAAAQGQPPARCE